MRTSLNTFGLPNNRYGLVDKQKQAVGLNEVDINASTPQITERDNLMMFDTRDCYGELSLQQAQLAFSYQAATSGKINPYLFRQSLNPDGTVNPQKLMNVVQNMQNDKLISGFPQKKSDDSPYIQGNIISFRLPKILKLLKSFEIINAIIPRDIIPMYVYFPGFINNCLPSTQTSLNPTNLEKSSSWISPVPETVEDFFDPNVQGISSNKLGGVFQTPLRYWRSYTGPNCMADPHTPPPYQLWNPPQDVQNTNPWPFQPVPTRNQRIPTYVAKNGVVFSGYGLYDLDDFPATQELQIADGTNIQIPIRKLMLKLLVSEGQYINGVSALSLIDSSKVDDFNDEGIVDNPLTQTGYGCYQRFIPGPGLAMNYQPNQWRDGKSAPIDLSCSTYDSDSGYLGPMPVPFPNFRGNVWGPYGRPGDRFQNKSVQFTVDELYMNGDLRNLEGNSIIWPNYNPTDGPYTFQLYILNSKRANNIVRFRTVESSQNPNIRNSMRVEYDGGFGAVYAYVGTNTSIRGGTGPIITGGLPNTQYDGTIHVFNPDIWVTPRDQNPGNWIQSLPGPQKPSIVSSSDTSSDSSSDTFQGWMYIWRNIFPWTGRIYVPVTAGGAGPMEHFESLEWKKSVGTSSEFNITSGSEQWAFSPVIGQSSGYCIPSSNSSSFEFVANVPYGQVQDIELFGGGNNYQDSFEDFPAVYPKYVVRSYDTSVTDVYTVEVTSVDSEGTVLAFNGLTIPGPSIEGIVYATLCGTNCTNPTIVTSGNNWTLYAPNTITPLTTSQGGSNYVEGENLLCISNTGSGSGLTVSITGVLSYGRIGTFEIVEEGSGYIVGDIITVLQQGSNNNATFRITEAVAIPENLIPEYSSFHYVDPLAVGPAQISDAGPRITSNYVNGVDTCTTDCPNNCLPPVGEYEYTVGSSNTAAANARDDPRPPPDPPSMLKCDFQAQQSPEAEWNAAIAENTANCRPSDNARVKQTSNYINRRVAYNDLGSNNGYFITSLVNYRSFFVSSTPDTDIVIRIKQAERDIYTQSLNMNIDQSNLNIPIRLNLGTTSGTLEYVEAVQGTLTSSGVYWKKEYFPPMAQMANLEISIWTYDGTPIPIERCLGFIEQLTDQAQLYSSSIAESFILHGSYSAYAPNLPPFVTTNTNVPSSVIITGNNNSKTLSDPFNPKLERYTQRNLGLMFKMVTYHSQNPGITDVIKSMPESNMQQSETFMDSYGNTKSLLPLAGNIDNYSN